jgi:hypothetical protein
MCIELFVNYEIVIAHELATCLACAQFVFALRRVWWVPIHVTHTHTHTHTHTTHTHTHTHTHTTHTHTHTHFLSRGCTALSFSALLAPLAPYCVVMIWSEGPASSKVRRPTRTHVLMFWVVLFNKNASLHCTQRQCWVFVRVIGTHEFQQSHRVRLGCFLSSDSLSNAAILTE